MERRIEPGRDGITNDGSEDLRLDRVLREAAVGVDADLRRAVMARIAALPEGARPVAAMGLGRGERRSWVVAAAASLLLALIAAGAAALASRGADGSVVSLLGALGDFLASSVLTGAGLLVASWRGAGLALRQALGGSVVSLAALAIVTVAVNYFLLRVWRARAVSSSAPAHAPARRREK